MRPSHDEYFASLTMLVSSRASCARRKVGCVLVDEHNHILATGYNGVARGQPHCTDTPCAGASVPSGQGLELCEAIHAEANALLQCKDKEAIVKAYCTTAPCVHCVKLLMNTACKEVIFIEDYPHSETSKRLWESSGRVWRQYSPHRLELADTDLRYMTTASVAWKG